METSPKPNRSQISGEPLSQTHPPPPSKGHSSGCQFTQFDSRASQLNVNTTCARSDIKTPVAKYMTFTDSR